MARHRVMIYHLAGAPEVTVETVVTADVDGETLEKRTNISAKSKAVMDCLTQLESLVDAEIGLTGDDPITAEKYAVRTEPE